MVTLNINDPKYYDPFIKTLKENTHINNHTENSNLIVYNFGQIVYQKCCFKLKIILRYTILCYFSSKTFCTTYNRDDNGSNISQCVILS